MHNLFRFCSKLLLTSAIVACSNTTNTDPKFLGVWLPVDGQSETKGFILEQGGRGSFTSKVMLEKYPHYRQAFNYTMSSDTITFNLLGEEGESCGWFQSDFTLKNGELMLDKPPSPLTSTSYRIVRR